MSAFDQLYLPGAVPLWCALFFGLAALWGYSQALKGDAGWLRFGRRGYNFFALSIVLVSFILVVCLWRRDFRIEYVQQYSGTDLATHFQIAAFWAGQKGSFLIWLLWGALLGVPLARSAGKDEPQVMWVYLLTQFGLLLILLRENPFVMLAESPADGAGLNPLLQDDWMVIHPPVMFIGYAASAIPFSFAVAAMWSGDLRRWAARAFPWALGGFLVLGTAILMGGYWAYRTLGWGGYWGWDPVENASLIPWLLGTVLIHGLYLERTRGRYRRLNLVIACLLFLSVLYGTFLTRSGVLADFSVHSFVDLGLTKWLLGIMGVFLALSVWLLWRRLPKVETRDNADPVFSRGFFMVAGTLVVGLSALMITVGTSAPLLTFFLENRGQVAPSFYNQANLPLALLISFLIALVPFLTWRGTPFSTVARQLVPSAGGALIVAGVGFANGVRGALHLLFLFLAGLALAASLHKVIDLARTRGLAKAGGYLAHVGVGCIFIGFLASSAYDVSTKVTLEQGKPTMVGDLSLTFLRFVPRDGHLKERLEVEVVRQDGERYLAYPKMFVNDRTGQMMVNPDIEKTLLADYYISPISYQPGEPPGIDRRLQLAKGESGEAGELSVRFVDFDLSAMGGNPDAVLASGGRLTLGAALEVSRGDSAVPLTPLYRFEQSGRVESPPTELPGGGWVAMTGLNPASQTVQLDFVGIDTPPTLSRLSIDLTRKPLIKLVWYGLYVVLAGGALATFQRFRAARQIDRLQAEGEGGPGDVGGQEADPDDRPTA